jgi:arginine-tRNA-protein transferase
VDSNRRYLEWPRPCSYLPERTARLEYEQAPDLTAEAYMRRMLVGWRRFGTTMLRPRCPACTSCRSLRVPTDRFRPDRTQRRTRRDNVGSVRICIGAPAVDEAKLGLYRRFHAHRSETRGWSDQSDETEESYRESFVDNPYATEEWTYFLGDELVGVGYVDVLPGGLSAITFFHEPRYARRSLGTWNILCLLERARALRLPFVYLGYFIDDCPSMAYKARFRPNEILGPDGNWIEFRGLHDRS